MLYKDHMGRPPGTAATVSTYHTNMPQESGIELDDENEAEEECKTVYVDF